MKYGHYDCFDTLPDHAFQRRDRYSMTLEGGGKGGGGSAPSPDPNIGKAEQQMADLSTTEYNTFMNQIYPTLKQQSQQQSDNANQVTQADLAAMKQQSALTTNYQDRITNVLQPLQDSIVADANNYNTPGYEQQQAESAMGDVSNAYDAQRSSQLQQQEAYGIDPTSGAAQTNNQALGVQESAAQAAAGTRARQAAEQLGWSRKLDAANMISGLPSNQTTSLTAATNAGASGLSAGQTGFNNTMATSGALGSATGSAMQGWGTVGQLGLGTFNAQTNAFNAQQAANAQTSAGWGGALGSGIGAYAALSDRTLKENIRPLGKTALGLPIYTYNYKDDPTKRLQVGVMAQDVKKAIPDAVIKVTSGKYAGKMAVDYSKVH